MKKKYTVRVSQLVMAYSVITVEAGSHIDAIHQAHDVEWDVLNHENKVQIDYDYTEYLSPLVLAAEPLTSIK